MRLAIAKAASDGLPARDLLQSLSHQAMYLAAWGHSDDGSDLKMSRESQQREPKRN